VNTCAPSVTNTKATPHNGEAPAHVLNVENQSSKTWVSISSVLSCTLKNKVKPEAVTKYRLHKKRARASFKGAQMRAKKSAESGDIAQAGKNHPHFLSSRYV
jgi:hypothetical protein